jgi:hypothetical protein
MIGLNEIPYGGSAAGIAALSPKEPRVALCFHRQCAWCLRLKHRDGTPHGHPWPRIPYYSHGICSICKAKLQQHHAVFSDPRPQVLDLGLIAPVRAA